MELLELERFLMLLMGEKWMFKHQILQFVIGGQITMDLATTGGNHWFILKTVLLQLKFYTQDKTLHVYL